MEHPRNDLAELRGTVSHLASEVRDMRQEFRSDIRHLDDRIFQLMLLQFGSLVAALAALVANFAL